MARRTRSDVNLLRLAELLQEHITPVLCHAAFGRVRKTERQRVWTLTARNRSGRSGANGLVRGYARGCGQE